MATAPVTTQDDNQATATTDSTVEQTQSGNTATTGAMASGDSDNKQNENNKDTANSNIKANNNEEMIESECTL